MQEEVVQKLVDHTSHKDSFQIIVSDDSTRFTKKFNPPIQLKKNRPYEIALVNLETYYSIPNISNKNNTLTYSANGGADWHTITIATGSYDIEDINDIIQGGMKLNGHWDEANEVVTSTELLDIRFIHFPQTFRLVTKSLKTLKQSFIYP